MPFLWANLVQPYLFLYPQVVVRWGGGSKKFFRSLRSRNCPPTFKTVAPPLAPSDEIYDCIGLDCAVFNVPSNTVDEIYDRSTQGTLCGLQFCRYLHSFICCCLPNIRTFELIAVQGHPRTKVIDLGVNRKRISNFLLVSSSNYGRICNYWVQVSTWWIVFGDVQYCT